MINVWFVSKWFRIGKEFKKSLFRYDLYWICHPHDIFHCVQWYSQDIHFTFTLITLIFLFTWEDLTSYTFCWQSKMQTIISLSSFELFYLIETFNPKADFIFLLTSKHLTLTSTRIANLSAHDPSEPLTPKQ